MSKARRFPGVALILFIEVSFAVAGASYASQDFGLDDILGRAVVSSPVAAEDAMRLAWMSNVRGVRNLWTAAAPDFTPLQLTAYAHDGGQPIGDLHLTADGSILVFVRGSSPNSAGEAANPSSDPAGAERAIWAVATSGGTPWKVAVAGNPVLAPGGDRLVYAEGSQVFEMTISPPIDGDEEAPAPEPAALFKARGDIGSLGFSDDGQRLAFVSDRGDHSFVGIFDRAGNTITWMAPSVDRDGFPAWSPDGRRVAFLRIQGRRIGERLDITAGRSFGVWVGDPTTGDAREIWRSPGEDGGFAQYYPPTPLAWAGNERLIFTSEHGGWHHAFSVAAAGGNAVDLTPGASEIESFVVSPEGATVYFWGNHGDVDRRHVWRVPSVGGPTEAVTTGTGIEVDPAPLADGETLVLRRADARYPMAIALVKGDGGNLRIIAPSGWPSPFPAASLVEPEPVSFRAADGTQIHGQLFLPPGAVARDRRPAVIFMHGGPIRQMLLGWHYRGYYANTYAFNQFLCHCGYVVLSVNFRSGIGYGRSFRQAPDQGPRGASEYQDIVAAGRYLQQRPEIDPERIGLWGGSYGGLLTAMGLARDSDLFAAGVDLHGVHDWAFRGTDFPLPGGVWGLGDDDLELAYDSSPVADLEGWRSPVLFVHGDDDRNVMFIQTSDLVQRLRDREVDVETLIFPDEVHGFYRYDSWLRTFRTAAEFFDRHLGSANPEVGCFEAGPPTSFITPPTE